MKEAARSGAAFVECHPASAPVTQAAAAQCA
jgi:hypothetical protein